MTSIALPARAPRSGARPILQRMLFVPFVRAVCRPLVVTGVERIPDEPVLFVANHASHADTAAIVAALPASQRARLAPAAAEDYFFRGRVRSAIAVALTGAFPFPRSGGAGLARAATLMTRGRSVLLFPEGTRTRTGSMNRFRSGAGVLATSGCTVVPVGIAGTVDVFGVGAKIPRRAPVAVTFGEPVRYTSGGGAPVRHASGEPSDVAAVTRDLERRVRALASEADRSRPSRERSLYTRAHALAMSRMGLLLAFLWGLAEAIVWPVVPDVAIVLLAVAAPRRVAWIVLAALAGSMTGGAIAYGLGSVVGAGVLEHIPLVTPRMRVAAVEWLHAEGGSGLWHQLRFGVPYKVFAWQAADAGVGLGDLERATFVVRGLRMLVVGAGFALFAMPWRRWAERLYGAFSAAFVVCFAIALARVVEAWS